MFRIAAAPASIQGEQRPFQARHTRNKVQLEKSKHTTGHTRENNARTREDNAHTRVDNSATRATIDEPRTTKGTRSKIKHTHTRATIYKTNQD